MELLLIPLLLVPGVIFFYLGINGLPQTIPAALPQMSMSFVATRVPSISPARASAPRKASGRQMEPELKEPSITQSDVLLADVLTELLEVRAELLEMRGKVAALESDVQKLSPAKPVAKTTARRTKAA